MAGLFFKAAESIGEKFKNLCSQDLQVTCREISREPPLVKGRRPPGVNRAVVVRKPVLYGQ